MVQRVLAREAYGAVQLVRDRGGLVHGAVRTQLRAGDREPGIARIRGKAGSARRAAHRGSFLGQQRQLVLHDLELAQCAPELHAVVDVRDRQREGALQCATRLHRAQQRAAGAQVAPCVLAPAGRQQRALVEHQIEARFAARAIARAPLRRGRGVVQREVFRTLVLESRQHARLAPAPRHAGQAQRHAALRDALPRRTLPC